MRLPYFSRRLWARVVSIHPRLLGLSLRLMWGVFAALSRLTNHSRFRLWRDYLSVFRRVETDLFAAAVLALERMPRFRNGSREMGHQGTLEAVLCRSAMFDPLFARGEWERTPNFDPLQRPMVFLPGIPAQGIHNASEFDWTSVLAAEFEAIKAEMLSVLEEDDELALYESGSGNPSWGMIYLYIQGDPQVENLRRCPKTWEVLKSLRRADREHNGFSTLTPGHRVPRHAGLINGSLRCLLPLTLPQGCGLLVGDTEVHWQEGEPLVFDDSYLHEAWNDSQQMRVILVLSTWHPGLSPEETAGLAEVLRASRQLGRTEIWKMCVRAQRETKSEPNR